MKIIFTTTIRKDFANFVFKTLANIKDGWDRILIHVSDGTESNKKSISKYSLGNVFFISNRKMTTNELMSGDNVRFFIEPFYQNSDIFCYLSTQWRFTGGKNLDIESLKEFINKEYNDLFKVEVIGKEFRLIQLIDNIENEKELLIPIKIKAYNRIYFGCPGTGKSTEVRNKAKGSRRETITFHPEFDYASFIGCYKPFTEVRNEEKIISYQFVAQAFIKLYLEAWKNLDKPYYFVIEEINRGNCAAIFGDIFQLLDRDKQGFSEYFISIDSDLAEYLKKELAETNYVENISILYSQKQEQECKNPFEVMLLPNNLSILATMNTSDQSLFPMDSAFKRRWEWKYIAIDYAEAKKFQLKIAGNSYNWGDFLFSINKQIFEITESEDKQMGTFFVVPEETTISEDVFLNKVLFYLWYDVLKNEGKETIAKVFPNIENEGFHYAAFFTLSAEAKKDWLITFFELHNIPVISNVSEQNENPN